LATATAALDVEVKDEEFRYHGPDPSIEDISETLSRNSEMPRYLAMRAAMLRKVGEAVEAGTLEWTSDTRASFGKVLRSYHEEYAPLFSAATVRWADSAVDKFCGWYQDTKKLDPEGDPSRARELESQQVEWEKRFRESLQKAIEPYLARAVPAVDEGRTTRISAESRAIELEAAEAACRPRRKRSADRQRSAAIVSSGRARIRRRSQACRNATATISSSRSAHSNPARDARKPTASIPIDPSMVPRISITRRDDCSPRRGGFDSGT